MDLIRGRDLRGRLAERLGEMLGQQAIAVQRLDARPRPAVPRLPRRFSRQALSGFEAVGAQKHLGVAFRLIFLVAGAAKQAPPARDAERFADDEPDNDYAEPEG